MQAAEDLIPPESWEGIRDLCTGRMQDPRLDSRTRIRWARLAADSSDKKATGGDLGLLKVASEQARITAYAIREFGVDHQDAVRDPNSLCRQIAASLPYGGVKSKGMRLDGGIYPLVRFSSSA